VSQETAKSFALDEKEMEHFERHGYIGPITVYDPDDMNRFWRTVRRHLLDRTQAAYPMDAESGATNIANYDRHLDVDLLADHICNRRIVERLTSILGPDVLCWRTEFFPKYPGDEGTDWHQADTFANASGKPQILWPGESESRFGAGTITVWTAFTDSTRENGCLLLMPGTHHEMKFDESKRMSYDPSSINQTDKDGIRRGFFGYDYRQLQIDPDWKPDEDDLAWAASARPDLDTAALDGESERFRNPALANRRTAHRWGPAWRIWISKAHGPTERPGENRNSPLAGRHAAGENLSDRESEAQWNARLARYRPGKFWLEGDWGPRPETGQSRVPAELLAAWRRRQEAA
jgi:chlorinating enzyme